VIVLNGAPRAGKSSIAETIQRSFPGTWVNLGVDVARAMTPAGLQPGIGLRPGESGHPVAAHVPVLFVALYESIAAHSRLGVNVVADVGHHDSAVLADCARRVAGLPAYLVGVRCSIDEIMVRRRATGMVPDGPAEGGIPAPVRRWQIAVHVPGIYDVEVDTTTSTPGECAEAILLHVAEGMPPSAFRRLAGSEGRGPRGGRTLGEC
jgi:chloramphenicol 3-O phosphotransferase